MKEFKDLLEKTLNDKYLNLYLENPKSDFHFLWV